MAKQSKNADGQYVRKETFWLVTLLALAVGFFGGVMFGVFKTDTAEMPGRPAPAPHPGRRPRQGQYRSLRLKRKSGPIPAILTPGSSWETLILIRTNTKNQSVPTARPWKSTRIMPMSGPIWASCIGATATRKKR